VELEQLVSGPAAEQMLWAALTEHFPPPPEKVEQEPATPGVDC
jgi:hypothetical protein